MWAHLTAAEQRSVTDALVTLMVVMGASLRTAHLVAAEFAAGLDKETAPCPT